MKTLLLPGLDGTGLLFGPLLRELDPALSPRVLSYPPEDVIELPLDQPFALVAESYSGPIAIRLAARQPLGLTALILVASFVRSPVRWLPRAAVLPAVLANLATSRFLIRATLVGRDAPDALVTAVRDAIRSVPPAVLASRVRTVLGIDARADLARCTCPLLYLAGNRDRIVSERMIDEIRGLRPDVVVEHIDAPHLVAQCRPAAVARAIEHFLGLTH